MKSIEKLIKLLFRLPTKSKKPSVSIGSIYLIGDTHFDHKNIIRYQHRPFSNVIEMNHAIRNNWNKTVDDTDTVYFLGDWTFGWGHKPAIYWKRQLKGVIVSIRGSHDQGARGIKLFNYKELHINGYDFLLIHDPDPNGKHQTQRQKQKLQNWHGWIIHGHVHNNRPFIDGEHKTINLSVEVINYRPMGLSDLLKDLDSIKRRRTINDEPERW
jgi:calcineurin-like phosphoesterase family protein